MGFPEGAQSLVARTHRDNANNNWHPDCLRAEQCSIAVYLRFVLRRCFTMRKYGEMGVNKYREMHDSRIAKSLRVIQREGFPTFLLRFAFYCQRVLLRLTGPAVIALLPEAHFSYQGKKLPYFRHTKGLAYTNERTVEVPVVMDYLKQKPGSKILEVGAVLHHYYPHLRKDVLDKFEPGPGIINEDIITFKPQQKYDLVLSISTLEHVGFDDDIRDSKGILKALNNIRKNCIRKGGEAIITLPIGYNKDVDKYLFSGKLEFQEEHYYRRTSWLNKWRELSKEEAKGIAYGGFHAEGIVIGRIIN